MTVARLYKRTVTQTTEQINVERSQMKETGNGREDSNKNKLVPRGKLCYYRHRGLFFEGPEMFSLTKSCTEQNLVAVVYMTFQAYALLCL